MHHENDYRSRFVLLAGMIFSLLMFSNAAFAAPPLIVNIENSPITSNQVLTIMDVERAIVQGCRVRGWQPRVIEPGHIEAVLYIRSHVAKVDIRFDTKTYSIKYKDSTNLDYRNGRIHRNYNKWVQNLNNDIQSKIPY